MGLLIVRLITLLNNENTNSTNYHIAFTLLNHYNLIHSASISEIATLCNVSKSTMSKFARLLGFDDYVDLKDNAPFVENRFDNSLNYVTNILSSIEKSGVTPYIDTIIDTINAYKEAIDLNAIDRVALALLNHQKVATFGLMFSESAAIDFQYKLAYVGKFILTFQNDLQQEEFLHTASADTLIIVFSNSGNFLQKQQLRTGTPKKNIFAQTKATVIVISANAEVVNLPFVNDAIIFPHQSGIQTHSFIYQIIMDLIVSRYRYYRLTSETKQ